MLDALGRFVDVASFIKDLKKGFSKLKSGMKNHEKAILQLASDNKILSIEIVHLRERLSSLEQEVRFKNSIIVNGAFQSATGDTGSSDHILPKQKSVNLDKPTDIIS